MAGIIGNFFKRIFSSIFKQKKELKLGFYGPPNAGKTSLANRICKHFTGEEVGTVSKIPHETRAIQFKEKVEISYKGKKMVFKIIDTPGIATKIEYAFPEYDVVGLSAKYGKNLEEFYESIFKLSKKV